MRRLSRLLTVLGVLLLLLCLSGNQSFAQCWTTCPWYWPQCYVAPQCYVVPQCYAVPCYSVPVCVAPAPTPVAVYETVQVPGHYVHYKAYVECPTPHYHEWDEWIPPYSYQRFVGYRYY
jgi:hypothetical protein